MRTREEIIARLFARTTQGIKFGVDRIKEATGRLNNPQDSYKIIHVAGTNGKGSVCAFLESLLRYQGYSTGLFTSPHLVNFEERFIVNGKPVLPEEWLEVYSDIEDIIDHYSLTFFEISTLIAFELFRRKKVDWAIIETGLGGRLDATNIVIPQATIITSLSVDHPEYLGDTLFSVAGEKLGIVKKNAPLIMAKHNDDSVTELALQTCKDSSAPFIVADEKEVDTVTQTGSGNKFQYKGMQYTISMCGKYQIINALCALKAFDALEMPTDDRTVQAIDKTYLPGRFQIVTVKGKEVIYDTAHNPDASANLCKEIKRRFGNKPVCIVTGIMADKDGIG
jgi:dihydrofolate synthase/folylpolyglutamate synthase